MRAELLGVRGSTAAPGAEYVRYGGHTSCVAITPDGGPHPTLVLDAGTGLRTLTARLGGQAYDGSVLLSHLHWDHVQGLPFFVAGDRDDARTDLYLPAQEGRSGRDLLAQTLTPPAFPITPEGLRGRWAFHALDAGRHDIEGFEVTAVDVSHKGGRTYGLRVADARGSLGYLPDHAPAAGVAPVLLEALAGVDVLLHDAQFVEAERAMADDYGHATVEDALAFARDCDAGTLVLIHHSPAREDDALDALGRWALEQREGPRVVVAREGDVLVVAAQPASEAR